MNETNIGVRVGATPEPLTARDAYAEVLDIVNGPWSASMKLDRLRDLVNARAALEGGVSPQPSYYVKATGGADAVVFVGEGGVSRTEPALTLPAGFEHWLGWADEASSAGRCFSVDAPERKSIRDAAVSLRNAHEFIRALLATKGQS